MKPIRGVIGGLPCCLVSMLACTFAASLTDEGVATALGAAQAGCLGESPYKQEPPAQIFSAGYHACASEKEKTKLTKSSEPQKPFENWDLVDEALKDPAVARARAFLFDKKVEGSLKMNAAAVMDKYVNRVSTHKEEQCDSLLKFDEMIDLLPNEFNVTTIGKEIDIIGEAAHKEDKAAKKAAKKEEKKDAKREAKKAAKSQSDEKPTWKDNLKYTFTGRNVAKMAIGGRLNAFTWSCCAYKEYLRQQICCKKGKNELKKENAKRKADAKRKEKTDEKKKKKKKKGTKPAKEKHNKKQEKAIRERKEKQSRSGARMDASSMQKADGQCCKRDKSKCCTSPKYTFTTSQVAKMEKTCLVLEQCRKQIPLFKGLRKGCQQAVLSQSAKTTQAKQSTDPVKCISDNLRVIPEIGASSDGPRPWQANLQFVKGSNPCGLLKLSTIRDAVSRWAVPKDGKSHSSPSSSFRTLAKGFYETGKGIPLIHKLNDVSTSVSKKVLVTEHGSSFTKTLVCLKWWTLRQAPNKRRRRRRRRRSSIARRRQSMGCKTGQPTSQIFNYSPRLPKKSGFRIPVNQERCLQDFLPNVVNEKVKEMCARAHFSKPQAKSACGKSSYSHYDHTLKTKAGMALTPPLACENDKFVCPLLPDFKCTMWKCGQNQRRRSNRGAKFVMLSSCKRFCQKKNQKAKETAAGKSSSTEHSCVSVKTANKCLKDVVRTSIRDAAMRLCVNEGYSLSTKCCTSSNAVFSSRLSAKERSLEEADFIQY